MADSTTIAPGIYEVSLAYGAQPLSEQEWRQAVLWELRTLNAILAANWPQIQAARVEARAGGGRLLEPEVKP